MSSRTAPVLARSLWWAFVLVQVPLVVSVARGETKSDQLFGMFMLGYATVGLLVASRRPGNPLGWIMLVIAVASALALLTEAYAAGRSRPAYVQVAWFGTSMWWVWIGLSLVFLPMLFPDGRALSPRWRSVGWLGALAMTVLVVATAFKPGRLDIEERIPNPYGAHGAAADAVAALYVLGNVALALAVVLSGTSLVLRFSRSQGIQRVQLKWFAFAGLLAIAGILVALAGVAFPGGWHEPVSTAGWFTSMFGCLVGIPAAIGIAMLRHRLWDIDRVINRTLVYGALTAALAAVYLGSVLLFRLALRPWVGESQLAVAASTLAVAGLFRPVRSRIQAAVDRRFFRSRYNTARTLETFSGRLRDELDLDTLGRALRNVVGDTMQPAHVSLWVREAPR